MRAWQMLVVAAAAIGLAAFTRLRRAADRRDDVEYWLTTCPAPDPAAVVIYGDDPCCETLPRESPSTQLRVHPALSVELVLADVDRLGDDTRVVVCAGQRDLRDGTPIADVVGDIAEIHDRLGPRLTVAATPRPSGRWGGAVDTLNSELARLCRERQIEFRAGIVVNG